MNRYSTGYRKLLSGVALMALTCGHQAVLAQTQTQANDGSEYIATWTAMAEACEDKYPSMKPTLAAFWDNTFDKAAKEKVAAMKQTPEFKATLARARARVLAQKDEIIAKCGKVFAPR